jgi:hypothetical protein
MALIWMTIVDDVAVTLAGVSTVRSRPRSESVVVAGALTVTVFEIDEDGAALPGQPAVRNVPAVEVAVFPAASRETAL